MNSPPEISLANPHHWGRRRLGSDSAIYCSSPDQFHSRGSLSLSPKRAHRQSGVSLSPQRPSDTLTQSEFSERRGKRPASRGSLSLSPKRAHRQSGGSLSPQRPSDAVTQSEFSERRGKRPASRGSLSLSPQQPRFDTDHENKLSVSDDSIAPSYSGDTVILSDSEDESGQVF